MSRKIEEEVAAGGIILIAGEDEQARVLLVHRPKYDDWSFPKGKARKGESPEETASREVKEETGLDCRLVRRLDPVRYEYRSRRGSPKKKVVHYWLMRPEGSAGERRTVPNEEVDLFEWLAPSEAIARLSYEVDREALGSVSALELSRTLAS
ncbi:MAG TPA: NUDIX hydrolase [Blastocatellia bacterium]|jgi:8-oxo-dGTP diphosphatase|nr:NUDIX hydrolase [Blastocatellia bacterium]